MVLLGRIIAISTCPLWCPSNPREIREWPRQQQQDRLLQSRLTPSTPHLHMELAMKLPPLAQPLSLLSATARKRTCSPRRPLHSIWGAGMARLQGSSFSGGSRQQNCTYMPRTAPPWVSLPFLRTRTKHPVGFSRFQLHTALTRKEGTLACFQCDGVSVASEWSQVKT